MKKFFSIRNCARLLIVLGVFYMIATFVLMAAIGPMVNAELAEEFSGEYIDAFSGIYTFTGVLIAVATGGFSLMIGVITLVCNRRPGREVVCIVLGSLAVINGIWSVITSLQIISLAVLFPLAQAALGCLIILRAKKQRDCNHNKQ